MSFREEERQKSNCPSRGLGLAAAAVGIGVGAAMYYFFSKRPENPHGEGATASGWQTETLDGCNVAARAKESDIDVDSDGYTTISENVTSDTSINDDHDFNASITSFTLPISSESEMHSTSTDMDWNTSFSDSDTTESSSEISFSDNSTSDSSITDDESVRIDIGHPTIRITMNNSVISTDSDVALEWDVTNSSEGVPEYSLSLMSRGRFYGNVSSMISLRSRRNLNRMTEERQLNILRDQAFRERPWSTEECSICFELIRREQEVMTLPCTHHFHQGCILPWLQEQQTCPNCRKRID